MHRRVGFLAFALIVSLLPACGSATSSRPVLSAALLSQMQSGYGKMDFTVNASRHISQAYDPGAATPTTLSVSDFAGYNWTLTIPPGATSVPTTIGLTPFASVSGSGGTALAGGLTFSPDGLQLQKAATLTVAPPSATLNAVPIYTSQSDGSQLHLAAITAKDTASIFHFSAGAGGPPMTLQQAKQQLQADEQTDQIDIQSQNPDPSSPPMTPLYCLDTGTLPGNPGINAYTTSFVEPELTWARQTGGALALAQLFGDQADNQAAQDDISGLLDRVNQRLQKAIKTNKDNPAAFAAIAHTALYAEATFTLRGATTKVSASEELSTWSAHLIDILVKEVKQSHKYSNLSEIMLIWRVGAQLGAPLANMPQDLEDAYRFNVQPVEDISAPLTTVAAGNVPSSGNAEIDGLVYVFTHLSAYAHVDGTVTADTLSSQPAFDSIVVKGTGNLSYTKAEDDAGIGFKLEGPLPTFQSTVTVTLQSLCSNPHAIVSQDAYGVDMSFSNGSVSAPVGNFMGDTIGGLAQATGSNGIMVPLKDGQASANHRLSMTDIPGMPAELAQILNAYLQYTVTHAPATTTRH